MVEGWVGAWIREGRIWGVGGIGMGLGKGRLSEYVYTYVYSIRL